MHRVRRFELRLAALVGAFGVAAGCASLDARSEGAFAGDFVEDGGGRGTVVQFDASPVEAGREGGVGNLHPLCGRLGLCGRQRTPDDVNACAGQDAGNAPVPDGGREASTVVPPERDAGTPDASADEPGDAGDGGLEGSAGGGADEDAGFRFDGPAHSPGLPTPSAVDAGPPLACQVTSDDYGRPVHLCQPAGSGGSGAPCSGPSDCRAGLACVARQDATANAPESTGRCLPYCCRRESADGSTGTVCEGITSSNGLPTYCGERPLLERAAGREPLLVPVCVPADDCRLLEDPFPCTGAACQCPVGSACTLVSADGATGCRRPGTGRAGEACNSTDRLCAAGYFCSAGTSTCVKICRTAASEGACAPGWCQAAPALPKGFGLCVGPAPALK